MIAEFLGGVLIVLLVSIAIYALVLAAENRRKYKFFEKFAPDLKVLPHPSLFGGHTNQFVYCRRNWLLAEQNLNKYGPTVGCFIGNRPAAITKDLDFIKTFTVDEQIHVNRIKIGVPMKELEDSIMFAEDEDWLRIRKAIGPAFAVHRIKAPNVQAEINGVIDKFIGMIDRRLDEAKEKENKDFIEEDSEKMCQRYALALLFQSFYKQSDVVDFDAREEKWTNVMNDILEDFIGVSIKISAAFPILNPLFNWIIMNYHVEGVLRRKIMGFIQQQADQNFKAAKEARGRIREQEERDNKHKQPSSDKATKFDADNFTLNDGTKFKRNMMDFVIDQYREGKITKDDYFSSSFFLWFAADKALADGLSMLLYNLARHPAIQKKLRESILVSGTDSQYLSWVVLESLRLHPPVPIGCSRTIKRDIQTKHGLVPAGTFVITPARTINRLKEYWGEDADQFRPDRWADQKNFHPVQYLSFGGGRRGCPGRELALMSIKMVLCAMLRKYTFSVDNVVDTSDEYDAPILAFLLFDSPTYVKISRLELSDI